jgi:hypothetical protein
MRVTFARCFSAGWCAERICITPFLSVVLNLSKLETGSARSLIKTFDVKKRRYFGNTSMEAEISLLMANQSLVNMAFHLSLFFPAKCARIMTGLARKVDLRPVYRNRKYGLCTLSMVFSFSQLYSKGGSNRRPPISVRWYSVRTSTVDKCEAKVTDNRVSCSPPVNTVFDSVSWTCAPLISPEILGDVVRSSTPSSPILLVSQRRDIKIQTLNDDSLFRRWCPSRRKATWP